MSATFRKRLNMPLSDRDPFSAVLRDIALSLEQGDAPAALRKANEVLARADLTPHGRARVLALVADSEKRRGDYERAATLYAKCAALTVDDHRLWVRPIMGQVQCLLKSAMIDKSRLMARHACDVAEAKFRQFDTSLAAATRDLESGKVVVEGRPFRPSVVAARMGALFLQDGELDAAEEFFRRAISLNKHGACRARQGLARIALAKGNYKEALERAEEAIRIGRYQAKTLGAWPIVIRARSRLGGGRISERLIKGLEKAPPSVRARAIRLIANELRQAGMAQWKRIAVEWLEREGSAFPATAAEIRKMILASWKAVPGRAEEKRAAAQHVLMTPQLGPREWLAAAKEYARWSLWARKPLEFTALLDAASRKYGRDFVPQARHGLALSCMLAKRHDLARHLLEQNLLELAPADETRSKSLWALARMESVLGDNERAANLYRAVYENPHTPSRFRIQARMLGLKERLKSGDRMPPHQLRSELASLLADVDDTTVLMDAARHIRLHVPALRVWSEELFRDAARRAVSDFWATRDQGVAVGLLLKVARCQVYDFGLAADAVSLWESLPQEKRLWLWSPDSRFWQYLGCVALAYTRLNQEREVRALAEEWLDDPATPPEGWVEIAVPLAEWWVGKRASFAEGMQLFEEVVARAPRYALAARAWYWKALVEHKKGNRDGRNRCCRAIRESQGSSPGLLSEWELDARALLLLVSLDVTRVDAQAVNYSAEFLKTQRECILRDLEKIP